MAGYHLTPIPKGILGTPSKIEEEFLEFKDAIAQNNNLMAMLELSDLIGAIEAYAEKHNFALLDLIVMMQATKRAFNDGTRKSRNDDTRSSNLSTPTS